MDLKKIRFEKKSAQLKISSNQMLLVHFVAGIIIKKKKSEECDSKGLSPLVCVLIAHSNLCNLKTYDLPTWSWRLVTNLRKWQY